jgi:hypothetical protein
VPSDQDSEAVDRRLPLLEKTVTSSARLKGILSHPARKLPPILVVPTSVLIQLSGVWRRLGGYKSCHAAKKPWLREANRVKRLQWAQAHRNWTPDQWRSVLWSDESKFELRYHALKRVWRKKGTRYDPRNTQGTVKHDKSVMVWGCFAYSGLGRLHRIQGIMKKEEYHAILQHQMFPSANALFGQNNWIFQQDNDPKHTVIINQAYLANRHVNVMDWPAQSPDLNPIENLWSELNRQLQDRACNTPDELFDVLKAGWEAIPQEYIQKLIDSMAVIRANGRATKY